MKNIVLLGGGHAHALVLVKMIKTPFQGCKIIMVSPQYKVPYTGMLPGYTAGHYSKSEIYMDLKSLSKKASVIFKKTKAIALDPNAQILTLENGERINYDVLSIDIGIHAHDLNIKGLKEYGVAVKPLENFALVWEKFCKRPPRVPHVTVIGGGIAAIEMILSMHHAFRNNPLNCRIVCRNKLLSRSSLPLKKYLKKQLSLKNIAWIDDHSVKEVTSESVVLDNDTVLHSDLTLSAIGAKPYAWLENTSLPLYRGFIVVNAFLQSPAFPNVFGVGDCIHFSPQPLDKAGVYAVKQAPILYYNLQAFINETALKTFSPQKHYLKLISTGEKFACAEKFSFCFASSFLWHLKNYIDRRFMKKFMNK